MTVLQLVQKLKTLPPNQIIVIRSPEGYNYDRVEILEKIEVETDLKEPKYGGKLTEYHTGNPRIKATLIR